MPAGSSRELEDSGRSRISEASFVSGRFIAVDDLMVYASILTRPTGIQRVGYNLAQALVEECGYQTVRVSGPAVRSASLGRPGTSTRLTRLAEMALSAAARLPGSIQQRLRAAGPAVIRRLRISESGAPVSVERDDWIIVLGAPWIAEGMTEGLLRLQRDHGVKISLLVHDLLPITAQQWFRGRVAVEAQHQVGTLIDRANLLTTVSTEVASEIRRLYGREATVVNPADPVLRPGNGSRRAQVNPVKYVLTVGTMHPRKNLAALVRIWDRWLGDVELEGRSDESVPELLVVGRRHPDDHDLRVEFATRRRAARKIRLLHTVSDHALGEIYENCRFVVMPSFAEGWGLPVREAFMHRKGVIATDGIPAAAGMPGAAVVSANDEEALYTTIRSWWESDEPELRAELIGHTFVPRNWAVVAAELDRAVADYAR